MTHRSRRPSGLPPPARPSPPPPSSPPPPPVPVVQREYQHGTPEQGSTSSLRCAASASARNRWNFL